MRTPLALEAPFDLSAVPAMAGVFLIHAERGKPYLARTALLRRRLARLLESPERLTKRLMLGGLARRVEYWPMASRLARASSSARMPRKRKRRCGRC